MTLAEQQEERKKRLVLLKQKRGISKPEIKARNFNFESKKPVSSFDILQKQQQQLDTDGPTSHLSNSDDLETKSKQVTLHLLQKFEEQAKELASQSTREDKKTTRPVLDEEVNELEKDDEAIPEYDEELKDELELLRQDTDLQLSRMIKTTLQSLIKSQNKD